MNVVFSKIFLFSIPILVLILVFQYLEPHNLSKNEAEMLFEQNK